MNPARFSTLLRQAILGVLQQFCAEQPAERPYAFALLGGQRGGYLMYAIATEEGLLRVAARYEQRGYRYQGTN